MNTLGIVEICPPKSPTSHLELPTECARRRFGDVSLLEWVTRRVTDCQWLDRVVVTCSDDYDRQTIEENVPVDIEIFVANQPDPLSCFAAAVRHFDAESAVRVDIRSPFVDPTLIDRLVSSARNTPDSDYAGFCSGNGRPVVQSRFGMLAEWCSAHAILQADEQATEPVDRQNSTRYLYTHPELFQLRLLPVPVELERDGLQPGLDWSADWNDAQVIYDALGPERLEWRSIAEILDQQVEVARPISN